MKKLTAITLFGLAGASFALQGGPTQPDYTEFEPSEMKDMVSLTSGNFAYSIPLGEVPSAYGSYPLSLSYHAGISPQKEATWVGLGWTLSPGSIIRDLRGVPDDQFHGGTLGFIYQYSALYDWRIDTGYSNGFFSVGLSASRLGGVGASAGVGLMIAGCVEVGFKVSTDQGLGVSAGVGYGGVGLNASAMYSPRSGDWTFGAEVSAGGDNVQASAGVQYTTGQDLSYSVGMSVGSENIPASLSVDWSKDGVGVGLSAGPMKADIRNGGTSVSLGPVSVSVANSTSNGNTTSSSTGFAIVVPTNVGVFSLGFNQTLHESRMRAATSDYVYGYMYQGGPAIIADGSNNIEEIPAAQTGFDEGKGHDTWDWTYKGRTMETLGDDKMQPAYDMFTIESEGVSGTFRAFPREEQQMFSLVSNRATQKKEKLEFYNPILNLDDNRWPSKEDFEYSNKKKVASEYAYYKADPSLDAPFADYKTQFRNEANRMVYRINKDSDKPLVSGMNFLFLGEGGYYESEEYGKTKSYGAGKVTGKQLKRILQDDNDPAKKIEYALYGSRKVEPVFEDENDPVSKIKGFVITSSNGTKYFFTQPVKSYLKVDYTINQEKGTPVFVDKKLSKNDGFWDNFGEAALTLIYPPKLLRGIKKAMTGVLDEKCGKDYSDENILYSYQVNMNPYATQWLLTEIQGPDYIQLDKKSNDIANTIGYNVRFKYSEEPTLYQWRSPYTRPNTKWSDLLNFRIPRNGMSPEGCDTKMYQASFGVKEYVYLESIETATHKVKFDLNDPATEERVDGKGWYFNRNNKDGKTLPILTAGAISVNVKSVKSETTKNVNVKKNSLTTQRLENKDVNQPIKNWHEAEFEYDALYVNVEIPEPLQKELRNHPTLKIESEYIGKFIHIGNENVIIPNIGEFVFDVDTESKNMVERTTGLETRHGLYKIKLKKGSGNKFYWQDKSANNALFNEAKDGKAQLVFAQNGMGYATISGEKKGFEMKQCTLDEESREEVDQNGNTYHSYTYYKPCNTKEKLTPPLLDWSDIVFSDDYSDPAKNQMRYLKRISYYNKKDIDNPYREYNFEYDYSLHPRTLNSYCKSRYPVNPLAIEDSPLNASMDVCTKDATSRYFYGKLTLKSITEKGCQNGRCTSLPPFKFDYNVASQTSTRYSVRNSWMEASLRNTPYAFKNSELSSSSTSENSSSSRTTFFSKDYYANFTDIDASIVATNNSVDEWGFWNIHATEYNHKVNWNFADYGAAAWSLNKVTDPAGGVMEIRYERDEYKNGEDHARDNLFVPIFRIGKCEDLINDYEFKTKTGTSFKPEYNNRTCAFFFPMYWHDKCVGPRSAFWDYEVPKGHQGGKYDYMDSLGIVKDKKLYKNQFVFFKVNTELSTEVPCGLWGIDNCDRYRQVGLFGSSSFLDMYDGVAEHIWTGDLPFEYFKEFYKGKLAYATHVGKEVRMLVLDKYYDMIKGGVQKAADKISDKNKWKHIYITGNMWAKRSYQAMKGGDLRVKSLVRYDIDRVAKTEYEYEPGEMAQLPDSAYTTVMGNGFNTDQYSFALPDVNVWPKSRIVGFEDNDLLYVPGSNVMYPKVTVKNSDDKGTVSNGKNVYEYITPEKGVPAEFIDPDTRSVLRPFIHVNVNYITWGGDDNNKDYMTRPSVLTFEFFDKNNNQIGKSMNILLQQNHTTSFKFYDDNVKDFYTMKVSYPYVVNGVQQTPEEVGTLSAGRYDEQGNFVIEKMDDFNEVMLTVAHINKKWHAYPGWIRSHEKGHYPILYKQVTYNRSKELIELKKVSDKEDALEAQKVYPDFEESIVYHDFTAFLGMNTKTSIYRGNDDKAILLKVDSNVYSTRVPDVLSGIAEGTDIAKKVGHQVEHWKSERELQCAYDSGEENKNVSDCKREYWSLGALNPIKATSLKNPNDEKSQNIYYYKDQVSFGYKRYPVFQIKSIVSNGFDNQEKQFDEISSSSISSIGSSSSSCDERCVRNKQRMHWTIMENHKYDPVTSNPTATLARIPAKNGEELRKLTVKLPHHAVMKSENGGETDLSRRLFKKNMLSQNFAEFVYFDSNPVSSSASWDDLEKIEYLKSFSVKPLNRYTGNLEYTDASGKKTPVEISKYPYIEWGSFTTKKEPNNIITNANNPSTNDPYVYVARFQDVALGTSSEKWPSKEEFDGNYVLQIDQYFRPIETKDVLGRRLSSHYSDDGLRQTGLFFPTERSNTASIVPAGDEITEVNLKKSIKKDLTVDFSKGGMVAQSSITLTSSTFNCSGELVAEYRVKKSGKKWQTVRESINDLNLTLSNGDILNYLRVYPENAEAKTYLYDRYGNMIQFVGEDNVSTYFEYNPLGQLIQTRNDDGVSFKSHHKEFTNDDRDEIPWTQNNSSSSSN